MAPQPFFFVLLCLSFLPCASKAASSAPKSPKKLQAEGCYAVFPLCLLARQIKRRREYLLYCQGVLCGIGGRQSAKTFRGSIPLGLNTKRGIPKNPSPVDVSVGKGIAKLVFLILTSFIISVFQTRSSVQNLFRANLYEKEPNCT